MCGPEESVSRNLRTAGGKPVIFVAHPNWRHRMPRTSTRGPMMFDDGRSWRARFLGIQPGGTPATRSACFPRGNSMNPHESSRMVNRFGLDSVFILSAGWGLIPARFLTPAYDITFSQVPKPERWKRRLQRRGRR